MIKPLTEIQKQRLQRLEPQLENAIRENDLQLAGRIVADIQNMLRPTGHEMRLIQSKNKLFEAHLENGDYDFAISGFAGIQQRINKNTRTYLESSVLLAICYIRKKDIIAAEPIIREVLVNDKVIKSQSRRTAFRKRVIERFNEECILFGLRDEGFELLKIDEVDREVVKLMGLTEEEVYQRLGEAVTYSALNSLLRIDHYSKKQLPSAERKLIGAPLQKSDTPTVGKTLFGSVRRVLYKSICDPDSEIYKTWFNNGMKVVLEKKFIVGAVVSILTGLGIGIKAIAISVVALIIKFGIEVFCDRYKPGGIMELR
ncbi:MAG TPA: hypothetical protein VL093_13575 [Flavipsychrobacter sp.]|nr:hypothetical protein [Flavipsychrobacter sp.]